MCAMGVRQEGNPFPEHSFLTLMQNISHPTVKERCEGEFIKAYEKMTAVLRESSGIYTGAAVRHHLSFLSSLGYFSHSVCS